MTITLGGETVKLFHVAPSHSNSMTMVLFPRHRALQCTNVCESKSLPYMDLLDFYYDGWIDTLDAGSCRTAAAPGDEGRPNTAGTFVSSPHHTLVLVRAYRAGPTGVAVKFTEIFQRASMHRRVRCLTHASTPG